MNFYVTYGGNTYQSYSFSKIEAKDYEDARAQVNAVCGNRFAFIYDDAGWLVDTAADGTTQVSQADKYGLHEIPLQRQVRKEETRTVLPLRFATEQEDVANLPKHEARDYSSTIPVDSEAGRMNKPAREGANFDEKIYMMPESFNALRREMHENWPALFATVGHSMAFDAVRFIELMDYALDTKTTFDSDKVSGICAKYLNLLRNKRGLSSI